MGRFRCVCSAGGDSVRLNLQLLTKMTRSLLRKLAEVFRSLVLSAVVAVRVSMLTLALAETAHRKSVCDAEDFNSAAALSSRVRLRSVLHSSRLLIKAALFRMQVSPHPLAHPVHLRTR